MPIATLAAEGLGDCGPELADIGVLRGGGSPLAPISRPGFLSSAGARGRRRRPPGTAPPGPRPGSEEARATGTQETETAATAAERAERAAARAGAAAETGGP